MEKDTVDDGDSPNHAQKKQKSSKGSSSSAPRKPNTAFFLFQAVKRDEAKKAHGATPSMQELSQQWKDLPDDEKQNYVLRAKEDQERYKVEQEKYQTDQGKAASEGLVLDDAEDDGGLDEDGASDERLRVKLPISRVQKVIKLDKEVSKVSKEAAFIITKATELFLERIVTDATKHTSQSNRKTILYKDFAGSIREVQNREVMQFLIDEFPAQAPGRVPGKQ